MNDISKLPKWAQNHIRNLERKAQDSRSKLDDFLDGSSPSSVYVKDIVCDTQSPRCVRRYIQTHNITFESDGLVVEVTIPDGIQGRTGVEVSFFAASGAVAEAALFPVASNMIAIKAVKEKSHD